MDTGAFAFALETQVRRFNGQFFRTRTVLPLGREEIGELRRAASADWKDVDPSIFGTLLEQALDKTERRRLGAHYTPRAYVERLVVATVIEPLRTDWETRCPPPNGKKPPDGRGKPWRRCGPSTPICARPASWTRRAGPGIFSMSRWNC